MPRALLLAALAGAAPLLAWLSESALGLVPCALCRWQRWPYWAAAGLALVAAAPVAGRRALLAAAGVAVLASGAVAALHVGVERGWWPSPLPGCAASAPAGGGDVDALLRGLAAAPARPCDAPTYPVPGLPASMAAMNLLYALAVGGLGLRFAATGDRA